MLCTNRSIKVPSLHVQSRQMCNSTSAHFQQVVYNQCGGVGERLKPAVLKTVRLERVSGVRIPPPPPENYVEVTEIFLSLQDEYYEVRRRRCKVFWRDPLPREWPAHIRVLRQALHRLCQRWPFQSTAGTGQASFRPSRRRCLVRRRQPARWLPISRKSAIWAAPSDPRVGRYCRAACRSAHRGTAAGRRAHQA
jgi:hypothetical protein